jgi:hypothetical protein
MCALSYLYLCPCKVYRLLYRPFYAVFVVGTVAISRSAVNAAYILSKGVFQMYLRSTLVR